MVTNPSKRILEKLTDCSTWKEWPLEMSKGKETDRMSSDEEWVEDDWVVMDDDVHAKWVCRQGFSVANLVLFPL